MVLVVTVLEGSAIGVDILGSEVVSAVMVES